VNRTMLLLVAATVVAFALIQAIRLLLGEGWSWIYTVGYGVALIALLIAARKSRNSNQVA